MTETALDIPRLDTARLILRAAEDRDFAAFAAFMASDRTGFIGGPYDRDAAADSFGALNETWARQGFGRWIVADRNDNRALGLVGLYFPDHWPEPEIAWSLFSGAEGQGFATEAARAARAYAYGRLGWRTVVSLIAPQNAASLRVAARMGCRYEADHLHPKHGTLQIWRHPGPERQR